MGFYRNIFIVAATILFFVSDGIAGSKTELPNDFTIELLGRCLIYSLSYQRMTTENFGFEVGASFLGGPNRSVAFLSGGGKFYLSSNNASPCLSGGITVITASTASGPFSGNANSGVYGYIGPGFEYRSPGGFLFRGTVYVLALDRFYVWPGVQLGIAF